MTTETTLHDDLKTALTLLRRVNTRAVAEREDPANDAHVATYTLIRAELHRALFFLGEAVEMARTIETDKGQGA